MANSKYRNDFETFFHEDMGYKILADQAQYAYVKAILAPPEEVQAVFCDSPAGTGKTAIALAAAYFLLHKGRMNKILYVRNTVAVREMGFLPGTAEEKEAAFMRPVVDVINRIGYKRNNQHLLADMLQSGQLECVSTSFLRGVDFEEPSVLIIDEAQNLELTELQTVLTRVHDNTKIILIGSHLQNDNPKIHKFGPKKEVLPFEIYIRHFANQVQIPVAIINLTKNYRGHFANWADRVQETVEDIASPFANIPLQTHPNTYPKTPAVTPYSATAILY